MAARSGAIIVKSFLGSENPVSMAEFKEFWDDCDADTRAQFAAEAAKALGMVKNAEGKFEEAA